MRRLFTRIARFFREKIKKEKNEETIKEIKEPEEQEEAYIEEVLETRVLTAKEREELEEMLSEEHWSNI